MRVLKKPALRPWPNKRSTRIWPTALGRLVFVLSYGVCRHGHLRLCGFPRDMAAASGIKMKRYTLADLEEAKRDADKGDSGKHSNPGRTRRWIRLANEKIDRIRTALIEQGDLPRPPKSPETVERERVARELFALSPNPEHNDLGEFEGVRYRCKYRKVDGAWIRRWEKIVSG
jgi:hypothetical protein